MPLKTSNANCVSPVNRNVPPLHAGIKTSSLYSCLLRRRWKRRGKFSMAMPSKMKWPQRKKQADAMVARLNMLTSNSLRQPIPKQMQQGLQLTPFGPKPTPYTPKPPPQPPALPPPIPLLPLLPSPAPLLFVPRLLAAAVLDAAKAAKDLARVAPSVTEKF